MIKHLFVPTLLFMLPVLLSAQDNNCSTWYNRVCLSYCSDASTLTGTSGLLCFDPGKTSPEQPARIPTCFNSPSEINRTPQVLLCLPDDLSHAEINLYKRVGSQWQLVLSNSDIFLDTNRDTPCDNCENPNHYLTLHDSYNKLTGTYYAQLSYQCSDSEPIGFPFYYEIVDAVSSADLSLSYTATTQFEIINDDPVIDGYIPYNGAVPGPELGPYSAGIRLSATGMGAPSQYTLTLSSVSCGNTGTGTPLYTTTLPVIGGQPVEFKFHNIPNWSSLIVNGGCYRVNLSGVSTCGPVSKTGFFRFTTICTYCRPGVEDRSDEGLSEQAVKLFPNPSNGTFHLIGSFERDFTVQLIQPTGQLLAEYHLPAGDNPVEITVPESVNQELLLVRISDGLRTLFQKHQVLRQ